MYIDYTQCTVDIDLLNACAMHECLDILSGIILLKACESGKQACSIANIQTSRSWHLSCSQLGLATTMGIKWKEMSCRKIQTAHLFPISDSAVSVPILV